MLRPPPAALRRTDVLSLLDCYGLKQLRRKALGTISLPRLRLDGCLYEAVPSELFPFGNACRHCAFYGTACYNRRKEFSCHADSRPDGIDVVFVLSRK